MYNNRTTLILKILIAIIITIDLIYLSETFTSILPGIQVFMIDVFKKSKPYYQKNSNQFRFPMICDFKN